MPLVLLLVALIGTVGFGFFSRSEDALVRDYLEMAEEELKTSNAGSITDVANPLALAPTAVNDPAETASLGDNSEEQGLFTKTEKVSDFAGLLLRRVLQFEDNDRAMFLVALDLGRRGRIGTARQMMRKIAPLDQVGYSAAHAWLAAERMQRSLSYADSEREVLLNDLHAATLWKDVTPDLVREYAYSLRNFGRPQEALAAVKQHAEKFPELQVTQVALALEAGDEREFKDISTTAKMRLKELFESGEATPREHLELAQVLIVMQEFSEAIQVAELGLKKNSQQSSSNETELVNRYLRQVLSEALLIRYQRSASATKTGVAVNLQFLDAAAKADPTNPRVIEEIARVVTQGRSATPEMLSALKKNLADGQLSEVGYLIIADSLIANGKSDIAIPHLEMALRRSPNNAIALNNLALCLAQKDPKEIPRAIQLIDRALMLAGPNATMLDTKGQILLISGDTAGAIICFEDAIRTEGDKLGTRQLLAESYRKMGMDDLARQQLARIEELKTQLAEQR